jgi:hypothetical protein
MGDKRIIEQTASSEIYNDDWFLKDSVLEGTTKISKDNLIDKIGASKINSIAEDYDSTSTYNKDDFAFYENKLYRCLANNTTGTWDGTKWEEFDLPTALITTAHNIETAEFTIGTYYSADDLVLKDGKLYQCVVGHNATEWKSQFWRSVTIDEMLGYLSDSIAPEHNQSTVYAVGDLVMHNKALWRCIQAGAGAFVNANWELVTVADLIAEAGQIDDVQVKTDGDYETVVENKIAKIDLSSVTAYGEVPNLPQSIATFKDGADAPMKSLKVAIEPQQEGSGDPSPTNVRPISGWDEVDVTRAGKNQWSLGNISGTKQIDINVNIPIGSWTFSCEITSADVDGTTSLIIVYYDDDTTFLTRLNRNTRVSYTLTATKHIKKISFYAGYNSSQSAGDTFTYANIQLEEGTTATTYEPYAGTTYTIDLDGTRYGVDLDVINGIGREYKEYPSYNGETLIGPWISDRDVYAEGTTPTIGAQVVDKGDISTFNTIPTAVKSLRGVNNVYANTGDINDCVYRRDMSSTIDDILARLEALEG